MLSNRSLPAVPPDEQPTPRHPYRRSAAILALLWVLATGGMSALLFRGLGTIETLVWLSAATLTAFVGYSFVLIWYLALTGRPTSLLPGLYPITLPGVGFLGMLGVIIVWLALLFGIATALPAGTPSGSILVVALALLAVWLTIVWRQRLTARLAMCGLAAGLAAGLTTAATRSLGGADPVPMLLGFAAVPFLVIGGGLLLDHTDLANFRSNEGRYSRSLSSFLRGCLFAIPPALVSVVIYALTAGQESWVERWWDPIYALAPAISEEAWARLFLTTLCYAMLRPGINTHPRLAVTVAVLVGVVTHGLASVPAQEIWSFTGAFSLLTGAAYGVPAALLFLKRDFEHAVGFHFALDFARYLSALFWL